MYVCLCMGVSDRDIREAMAGGARSVADVMRCTGAGTRCGSCQPTLVTLVRRAERSGEEAPASGRQALDDRIPTSTAA